MSEKVQPHQQQKKEAPSLLVQALRNPNTPVTRRIAIVTLASGAALLFGEVAYAAPTDTETSKNQVVTPEQFINNLEVGKYYTLSATNPERVTGNFDDRVDMKTGEGGREQDSLDIYKFQKVEKDGITTHDLPICDWGGGKLDAHSGYNSPLYPIENALFVGEKTWFPKGVENSQFAKDQELEIKVRVTREYLKGDTDGNPTGDKLLVVYRIPITPNQ